MLMLILIVVVMMNYNNNNIIIILAIIMPGFHTWFAYLVLHCLDGHYGYWCALRVPIDRAFFGAIPDCWLARGESVSSCSSDQW